LLGVWKEKQLVGRRLLPYDTTNFYTYIAGTDDRADLAQDGDNKQGRHDLRQVGLSYVLDGDDGISLCHHLYPGNAADVSGATEPVGMLNDAVLNQGATASMCPALCQLARISNARNRAGR
jgi:transposase